MRAGSVGLGRTRLDLKLSDRDTAYDPTVLTPGAKAPRSPSTALKSRHAQLGEEFLGRTIGGRYLLKSIVGAGGFGAVFEGEDTRIKKKVAVKLLFSDMLRDHEVVIRFKLEAEAASQVGHANIIDITDFDFTDDSTAYMVMEFLEGEDLAHIIRRAETPDLARMVRICAQACRGLGAAHRKGIVHRDLKPGNIFVSQREGASEQVKVVDFGISRASELDGSEERLTKTGQILGTPYYMAPEQADGVREADGRADIYAMGVILYEACTGELPFMARTPIGLITKHATEVPRPPAERNPRIPELLNNAILKALEKNPEDRFADMVEMEQVLLHCLALLDPAAAAVEMAAFAPGTDSTRRPLSEEAIGVLATPPSILRRTSPQASPAPAWRRRLGWGLAALLVLGGGLAVLAYGSRSPSSRGGSGPGGGKGARTGLAVMGPDLRSSPGPGSMRRSAARAMGSAMSPVRSPAMSPAMSPVAPMLPAKVRITCDRMVPPDVWVYDRARKKLGSCKEGFHLPRGTREVRLRLYRMGWVEHWIRLVPDRDRKIGPHKLRKIGKGDGWKPPDHAMGW